MKGSPRRNEWLSTALVTHLLTVAVLPSLSSATGPAHPEIVDACGDVDPGATLSPTGGNASAFANRSAYDLRDVYVLLETSTDFLLVFHACDLPDAWSSNATVSTAIPVGANASAPTVRFVANFTIKAVVYEVRASLATPEAGALRESYELYKGAANQSLQGAVNASRDTVTVRVPKTLVDHPSAGDTLSKFRAEGWFRDARLDFAPDAVAWTPSSDPGQIPVLVEQLDGAHYYEPAYGHDYSFGAYPTPSATLHLETAELGRLVVAGQSTQYGFYVVNSAPLADQVSLTLNPAGPGFAHQLNATTLLLQPGERRLVHLTASARAEMRGDLYSLITASSTLGETDSRAFVTRFYGSDDPFVEAPGPSDVPGQTTPNGGNPWIGADASAGANAPRQDLSSARPRAKQTPALAQTFGLAALATSMLVLRRRR